jgi:hypothetical protein
MLINWHWENNYYIAHRYTNSGTLRRIIFKCTYWPTILSFQLMDYYNIECMNVCVSTKQDNAASIPVIMYSLRAQKEVEDLSKVRCIQTLISTLFHQPSKKQSLESYLTTSHTEQVKKKVWINFFSSYIAGYNLDVRVIISVVW